MYSRQHRPSRSTWLRDHYDDEINGNEQYVPECASSTFGTLPPTWRSAEQREERRNMSVQPEMEPRGQNQTRMMIPQQESRNYHKTPITVSSKDSWEGHETLPQCLPSKRLGSPIMMEKYPRKRHQSYDPGGNMHTPRNSGRASTQRLSGEEYNISYRRRFLSGFKRDPSASLQRTPINRSIVANLVPSHPGSPFDGWPQNEVPYESPRTPSKKYLDEREFHHGSPGYREIGQHYYDYPESPRRQSTPHRTRGKLHHSNARQQKNQIAEHGAYMRAQSQPPSPEQPKSRPDFEDGNFQFENDEVRGFTDQYETPRSRFIRTQTIVLESRQQKRGRGNSPGRQVQDGFAVRDPYSREVTPSLASPFTGGGSATKRAWREGLLAKGFQTSRERGPSDLGSGKPIGFQGGDRSMLGASSLERGREQSSTPELDFQRAQSVAPPSQVYYDAAEEPSEEEISSGKGRELQRDRVGDNDSNNQRTIPSSITQNDDALFVTPAVTPSTQQGRFQPSIINTGGEVPSYVVDLTDTTPTRPARQVAETTEPFKSVTMKHRVAPRQEPESHKMRSRSKSMPPGAIPLPHTPKAVRTKGQRKKEKISESKTAQEQAVKGHTSKELSTKQSIIKSTKVQEPRPPKSPNYASKASKVKSSKSVIDPETFRQKRAAEVIINKEVQAEQEELEGALFGEIVVESEGVNLKRIEEERLEAQRIKEVKAAEKFEKEEAKKAAALAKQKLQAEEAQKSRIQREKEEIEKKIARDAERKKRDEEEERLRDAKRRKAAEKIEADRKKLAEEAEAKKKEKQLTEEKAQADSNALTAAKAKIEESKKQAASLNAVKKKDEEKTSKEDKRAEAITPPTSPILASTPNLLISNPFFEDEDGDEDSLFIPQEIPSEIKPFASVNTAMLFPAPTPKSMIAKLNIERDLTALKKKREVAQAAQTRLKQRWDAKARTGEGYQGPDPSRPVSEQPKRGSNTTTPKRKLRAPPKPKTTPKALAPAQQTDKATVPRPRQEPRTAIENPQPLFTQQNTTQPVSKILPTQATRKAPEPPKPILAPPPKINTPSIVEDEDEDENWLENALEEDTAPKPKIFFPAPKLLGEATFGEANNISQAFQPSQCQPQSQLSELGNNDGSDGELEVIASPKKESKKKASNPSLAKERTAIFSTPVPIFVHPVDQLEHNKNGILGDPAPKLVGPSGGAGPLKHQVETSEPSKSSSRLISDEERQKLDDQNRAVRASVEKRARARRPSRPAKTEAEIEANKKKKETEKKRRDSNAREKKKQQFIIEANTRGVELTENVLEDKLEKFMNRRARECARERPGKSKGKKADSFPNPNDALVQSLQVTSFPLPPLPKPHIEVENEDEDDLPLEEQLRRAKQQEMQYKLNKHGERYGHTYSAAAQANTVADLDESDVSEEDPDPENSQPPIPSLVISRTSSNLSSVIGNEPDGNVVTYDAESGAYAPPPAVEARQVAKRQASRPFVRPLAPSVEMSALAVLHVASADNPNELINVFMVRQMRIIKGEEKQSKVVGIFLKPQEANNKVLELLEKMRTPSHRGYSQSTDDDGFVNGEIIYSNAEGAENSTTIWVEAQVQTPAEYPDLDRNQIVRRWPIKTYNVVKYVTRSEEVDKVQHHYYHEPEFIAQHTNVRTANKEAEDVLREAVKPGGARMDWVFQWKDMICPVFEEERKNADSENRGLRVEIEKDEEQLQWCGFDSVKVVVEEVLVRGPKN